jgi:hypothetical protein
MIYLPEEWSWSYDYTRPYSTSVQLSAKIIEIGGIPISGVLYFIVIILLVIKVRLFKSETMKFEIIFWEGKTICVQNSPNLIHFVWNLSLFFLGRQNDAHQINLFRIVLIPWPWEGAGTPNCWSSYYKTSSLQKLSSGPKKLSSGLSHDDFSFETFLLFCNPVHASLHFMNGE